MIDQMVRAFEYTVGFILRSVDDLSEEEMVVQPAGVPNHAAWTLGHITYACQGMATELGAAPWLYDDWESVFGYGSTPRPDGQHYPQKGELQALLSDSATRLCESVRNADESVLQQALSDKDFPSMGHVLLQVVVAHTAYHAGQLAVWRRAMGKESVAVYV